MMPPASAARRAFLLALLLLLLVAGRSLAGAFWSNAAFLRLRAAADPTLWAANNPAVQANFSRALALDPGSGAAARGLGFAHQAAGNTPAALAAWATVPTMPAELAAWARRAEAAGSMDAAIERYAIAAALAPDWADPWYFRGVLLENDGQLLAAGESYVQALQASRRERVGAGDIHYRLGRVAAAGQPPDLATARRAFDKALSLGDFSSVDLRARTLSARGEARRALGDAPGARADFAAALALDPAHYWAALYLGELVWELDEDGRQAEVLWQAAIDLDPGLKWPYRNLGALYAATGRYAAAAVAFEAVLTRDPADPIALAGLAALPGAAAP